MYSQYMKLGRCQSLWQQKLCGHHLFSFPSSGAIVRTYSEKFVDGDAFGLLSSLSPSETETSSKEKHNFETLRNFPKLKYKEMLCELNVKDDHLCHNSKDNYHNRSTGEIWSRLQEADSGKTMKSEDTEIEEISLNEVSENELNRIVKINCDGDHIARAGQDQKRVEKKKTLSFVSDYDTEYSDDKFEVKNEYSDEHRIVDPDSFGTISPLKLENETDNGDEGDEREQKYQESLTERRHRPQYYGQQMKKLCQAGKVCTLCILFDS